MRSAKFSVGFTAVLAMFAASPFVTGTRAGAQQEKVLHSFNPNSRDGNEVNAGVILDAAGNLYGTTTGGGDYNSGTVYELSQQVKGVWTEARLHDFGQGNDGALPWAGLIFDAAGNLYGTTNGGGTYGYGTVFELMPNTGGGWTEKILYSFNNNFNGYPSSLILDVAGNLYGTISAGGIYGQGQVFELTPNGGGGWTEKILHDFNNNGDGFYPEASLVFDSAGNLYGTTFGGGARGGGTVFELTPTSAGDWTESVLHSFGVAGKDGSLPADSLIIDAAGNLYGTTVGGGDYRKGVVFELKPKAGGGWTEKVLHSFNPNGVDGFQPRAGLVVDAAGNLYGTTPNGGAQWIGAVFKLTPAAGGNWTESILYSFRPGNDAGAPDFGLTIDAAGRLYGTSTNSGVYGGGTVYEVIP